MPFSHTMALCGKHLATQMERGLQGEALTERAPVASCQYISQPQHIDGSVVASRYKTQLPRNLKRASNPFFYSAPMCSLRDESKNEYTAEAETSNMLLYRLNFGHVSLTPLGAKQATVLASGVQARDISSHPKSLGLQGGTTPAQKKKAQCICCTSGPPTQTSLHQSAPTEYLLHKSEQGLSSGRESNSLDMSMIPTSL